MSFDIKRRIVTCTLISLILILSSLFIYSFTSNDLLAGFTSDDAVYLLLADLYSFHTTGDRAVYELIRQQSFFPPLYPLVLGFLGGNSANPEFAGLLTVTFLLVSIVISGIWIRKETLCIPFASTISLITVFLPGTLVLVQDLWSEFLFMVFLYGTFLLGHKKILSGQEWLGMALLIALGTLTRSIGISLAAAYCLLLIHRKPKYSGFYALVSITPFLFWNIFRENNPDRTGYITTVLSNVPALSFRDVSETVYGKFISLFDGFKWIFSSIETNFVHRLFSSIALLIFTVILVYGLYARVRVFRLDAIFFFFYIAIIFVWPYDDVYYTSRFLFPLVPLLFLYFYLGLKNLLEDNRYFTRVLAAFLVPLLIVSFPSTAQYIQRGYLDINTELNPYRRNRQWLTTTDEEEAIKLAENSAYIIDVLKKVSRHVPEGECIYSIQAPLVMLYTKRVSGVLPGVETGDEEFFKATAACKFFLSMPVVDAEGHYPRFYPITRLMNEQHKISAVFRNTGESNNTEIYLLERINDTYPQE